MTDKTTKPIRFCSDSNGIIFFCPACQSPHSIPIRGQNAWGFNYDDAKPTITPSIKVTCPLPSGETVCHSFVTEGRIQFCGDCTHSFSGQTVDLPPWPYAPGEFGGLDETDEPDDEARWIKAMNERENDCEQMGVEP